MAAEVDAMLSPPLDEDISTCQVDERMETGQASAGGQQLVGLGEMAQGNAGASEVSIKMLMSSKVSEL